MMGRRGKRPNPDSLNYSKTKYTIKRLKFIYDNGLDPRTKYPYCDICSGMYTKVVGRWLLCDKCSDDRTSNYLSSLELPPIEYKVYVDESELRKIVLAKLYEVKKIEMKACENLLKFGEELGYKFNPMHEEY